MGEVLPPKRQTVVDRLRKRLEIYRRHQSSCLPRYDQAANGINDSQRHETLLLKQRFLEAKAKKTKRSDNRHAAQRDNNLNGVANNNVGNNNCDTKTSLVAQSKLKRAAGSPLLDCALDGLSDSHPNKIPRNSTPDHPNNSNHHHQQQQQSQQQQTGMPSFSVQIVQQFSSNTSKSPHSQTIQTNVTVQTLPGGQIKTSNSPMTTTTASPGVQSGDGGTNILSNNPGNSGTPGAPSTSISVGTSIECKQEPPDNNFAPCSLANTRTMANNLNSELSMNNGNNLGTPQGNTLGDRFSDSLANLGFPEDSSDDVIHPDILKDIIDDVFTNPSDLMNGFSFVDNLKDTSGGSIGDDKDSSPNSLRNVLGNSKPLTNNTSSVPLNHFQNNMGSTQFSVSQSQQSVFDFHSGGINNTTNVNNVNVSQSFPQTRMSSYAATSPNLNSMNTNNANNAALGLDFKLTEPSPAAQTLKQMAEQHQNMQQKQQQQLGHLHPRSPFGSDSFPDPLSNMRSNNFLNSSPTSIMQKSPNSLFQSMGFNNANNNQQQIFPGAAPVKQEVSSPVPPMYANINSPPVQLADLEQLHKRRQALQMQQQQQQPRPPFSHSPDQKSVGMSQGGGPTAYMATRPLSHYNDPISMGSVPSHGSASNSPVSHPGQFMRGVSTPGVTPPPPPPQNFVSSPSSGTALHLSQSQQLQISQGQQLQVSQSQQQILVTQDMKPSISPQTQQQQQQQQQHVQTRNFYPGHHSSVHMSQSQSVSFQFGGNPGACAPNPSQRTQAPPTHATTTPQRQMQQQYASRPPPDYQSPLDTNSMNINQHQPQPTLNPQVDNRIVNPGQRGRKTLHVPQPYMAQNQRDLTIPPQSSNNTLLMSRTTPPLTVTTSGRGRGAKSNSRVGASKQGYPRLQRPPNVNVGPEGLNISQRPPGLSTDWRHVFMQQQQQQQINTNAPVRISYSRAPMSSNYGQSMASYPSSGTVQIDPNSNVVPVSGGMSRVDHLMTNNMAQMSAVPTSNVQFMMQQQQQQQAMMQSRLGTNSNSLLTTSQLQMSGAAVGLPIRDSNQLQQNMFSNDNKPPPSTIKLDESSQSITDSNQFILDFLDNIDCSTSDLLNFDMPGNGSSFPLLDDMSKMLGQ